MKMRKTLFYINLIYEGEYCFFNFLNILNYD